MAGSPRSRRQRSTAQSSHPSHPTPRSSSPVTVPTIPRGPCNWRNLQQGLQSSTCGCRRFWSRAFSPQQENGNSSGRSILAIERTSCFCGHHACFHVEQETSAAPSASQDHGSTTQYDGSQSMAPPHIPTQIGRSHRPDQHFRQPPTRHSPGQVSRSRPSAHPSLDSLFEDARGTSRQIILNTPGQKRLDCAQVSGLGLYVESTRNDSAHKLSAAARFAIEQGDSRRTPSRMTPTEVASERSGPVHASPSRLFSDHIAKQRLDALELQIPHASATCGVNPDDLAQSATEVATPSNAGTPALRAADDAFEQIKAGVETLQEDVVKMRPSPKNVAQRLDAASQYSRTSQMKNAKAVTTSPFAGSDKGDGQSTMTSLIAHVASLRHLLAETPNLGVSLANLGQRVDALESASFANSAIEEHNERFENFDGRVLDIENRVDELEKFWEECVELSESYSGASPGESRIERQHGLAYTGPTPLVDMRSSQHTVDPRATVIQRLRSIEQRLSHLGDKRIEAAPAPSVEVIYLPWGANLRGIWHESRDASQASGAPGQASEATQSASLTKPPNRHRMASSDRALAHAIFQEWPHAELSAKALGPSSGRGGRVYERLQSRGFVRNVTFHESDARSVYEAICTEFADVFRLEQQHQESRANHKRDEGSAHEHGALLALRSAFVPLRKIHKHSRLRFLSESELTTPALWNLQFLESSVFMKAPSIGSIRLFITTPAAYLQNEHASGWSWHKLRELPRVPELQAKVALQNEHIAAPGGVAEADALEPCWKHDLKLDPSESQQSSFAASVSFESSHHPSPPETKHGVDVEDDDEDEDSDYEEAYSSESEFSEFSSNESQQRSHHPITPISDLPASSRAAPGQRRAVSMPSSNPILTSSMPHITVAEQPHPKRQVASFDQPTSSYPEVVPPARSASSLSKRRRLSRTPSNRAGAEGEAAWALTPGRSHDTGRQSRDEEEAEALYQEHIAAQARVRGARVPLKGRIGPYATPYSFGAKLRDVDMSDDLSDGEDGDFSAVLDEDDDDDDEEDFREEMEGDEDEEDEDMSGAEVLPPIDPAFADEPTHSTDSEMEIDEAITLQEEAWADGDEDDDEIHFSKGTRRRVGHKRRKTGPRNKAVDVAEEDEDKPVEVAEDEEDFNGFDDDEDAGGDAAGGSHAHGNGGVGGGDSDEESEADELGA